MEGKVLGPEGNVEIIDSSIKGNDESKKVQKQNVQKNPEHYEETNLWILDIEEEDKTNVNSTENIS